MVACKRMTKRGVATTYTFYMLLMLATPLFEAGGAFLLARGGVKPTVMS